MDTKEFFSFINAIYDGYNRNVSAMCNETISIEHWAGKLSNKRKAFEACAFSCYVENKQFRDKVVIYYNRLKESLINYEKSHWFDYDFSINEDRRKHFEQKYHVIRRREITLACEFLDKLLNGSLDNPNNKELIDELSHYNLSYNDEQFKLIYDFLIEGKYIDTSITLENFIYYFSGKGEKIQNGLKWKNSKVNLALFLAELCNDEDKRWEKAKNIFGVDGLAQSYSNTAYRKNASNPFEELTMQLRIK